MLQIDPRLIEPCPEPSAILRYLRGQNCGIVDVQSVQIETVPCLKFSYEGDGVGLQKILQDKHYLPVSESRGEFVTYAVKRKRITVKAGQTFTVPMDYKVRGRVRTRLVQTSPSQSTEETYQDNVIEGGKSYAILRFAEGEKLPVVLEVDADMWQNDWQGNAATANEQGAGKIVSFEEMRWIYRTALLAIEE